MGGWLAGWRPGGACARTHFLVLLMAHARKHERTGSIKQSCKNLARTSAADRRSRLQYLIKVQMQCSAAPAYRSGPVTRTAHPLLPESVMQIRLGNGAARKSLLGAFDSASRSGQRQRCLHRFVRHLVHTCHLQGWGGHAAKSLSFFLWSSSWVWRDSLRLALTFGKTGVQAPSANQSCEDAHGQKAGA